ncbi:hypothetical protein ScPMuIL_012393 [Solemya velum]
MSCRVPWTRNGNSRMPFPGGFKQCVYFEVLFVSKTLKIATAQRQIRARSDRRLNSSQCTRHSSYEGGMFSSDAKP